MTAKNGQHNRGADTDESRLATVVTWLELCAGLSAIPLIVAFRLVPAGIHPGAEYPSIADIQYGQPWFWGMLAAFVVPMLIWTVLLVLWHVDERLEGRRYAGTLLPLIGLWGLVDLLGKAGLLDLV